MKRWRNIIVVVPLSIPFISSDEDDWNDVVMECSSLASHWEELCAYLGLRMGTIEVIKAKHHDKDQACWNSSLHNWILQKYNTEKYGYPSWRTLLKAVGRVDGALFNKLAEEHQLEGVYSTKIYIPQRIFYYTVT